jgi:HK97 family phage portal protein
VWAPRDYATFAREGFAQNAIVYRCVRMVAEAAASVPLLLYEGPHEIETHPLLDLIARPNPVSSAPDLLESWYGFLLVSGNAYLEAVALDGQLRELHALRPDRMKVIPGLEGWPEAFEYTAAGRSVRFAGEVVPGVRPILHVRLFNPVNDHYGLSPIEAAATSIDIHNTASKWNKALLDNSARPSGALVYTSREGNLSPEQFERLKAELEQGFAGAAHAGRPMLLEGGLDWKSMSLSPKDMDFIEAKHVAAREIALALGVPPMLLGIPGDNTYSNYQEATRTFWRSTVLPLVTRTAKALSTWLSPAYGGVRPSGSDTMAPPLELRPDLDAIEALNPEREALWTRIDKATFLTPNEKRAAVGYGPFDENPANLSCKYRPDQARDEIGRWVDEAGGGRAGPAGGNEPETNRTRVAQGDRLSGYPVDLREEDRRGGHTIEQHVNVSYERLAERVQREADATVERGHDFRGLSVGSFTSLDAATKLANSTISENSEKVARFIRGSASIAVIEKRFEAPTGYEAYLERRNSQPYMHDTYGVRVLLLRGPGSSKGYHVRSAFPIR